MTMRPQVVTTVQQTGDTFSSITSMITAIMPLIMMVMMFKMLTPMLEGFGK